MTLLVEAPAGREPERRYVLDVVLRRWLGQDWALRVGDRPDVRLTMAGAGRAAHVSLPDILFSTPRPRWLTPASLPRGPVARRPTGAPAAGGDGACLPALYAEPATAPLLGSEEGGVRLGLDVFGAVFFMLSRYEEAVVRERDRYGRFPAAASLAAREGFLDMPLGDAYVDLLWTALASQWPRLRRPRRTYGLTVTHDVDRPLARLGRTPRALAAQLAADAVVRRDARLAARRVRSWAASARGDHGPDPYNTFDFLMDVSERNGVRSAFNFIAAEEPAPHNGHYTLAHPWIRSLVRHIHERGHEIGFHAGLGTFRDVRRTAAEFHRLRATASSLGIAQTSWGGRQHYLQWETPATWSNWERAGLDYDSSVGFADRVGFRAGTSREYPAFDLHERRALRLLERPLHVMDGTLFGYMRLGRSAAAERTLRIAGECRRHGGTLTILWHNSSILTTADRRWYERLVAALVDPAPGP
jgi:hypothetical protein